MNLGDKTGLVVIVVQVMDLNNVAQIDVTVLALSVMHGLTDLTSF